jgi:anti-sigma regulatory factor (Ser/Thr protein kinase)
MLIDIKNDVKEIDRVCDKVKNFCMEHSISNEKYHDIILILDEITSNIINYAYPDDKEHWFSVFLEKKEERLVIKFLDNGMAFNPLKKETPDTESSIEERQIGGLGIFIVKQLSEFIEYSRIDDKNQLEITVSVSTNFHK